MHVHQRPVRVGQALSRLLPLQRFDAMEERMGTDHGFLVEIWKPVAPGNGNEHGISLNPRTGGITLHDTSGRSSDLREEAAQLFLPPQGGAAAGAHSICPPSFYESREGCLPAPYTMAIQVQPWRTAGQQRCTAPAGGPSWL